MENAGDEGGTGLAWSTSANALLDDDAWVQAMEDQGAASIVKEVDDGAWVSAAQSLNGAAMDGPIPLDGAAGRLLAAAWLRRYQPHSLPLLAHLVRHDSTHDATKFFVDALPEPAAIAAVKYDEGRDRQSVGCFSLSAAAAAALMAAVVVPGRPAIFQHFDGGILEQAMLPVMGRIGLTRTWAERAGLWALPKDADAESLTKALAEAVQACKASAAGGLETLDFAPLEEASAETVDRHWRYQFPGSVNLVKSLIARGPTVAARVNGALASWCLVYNEGSLAMLHTRRKWRGRGLARAVVLHVVLEYLKLVEADPAQHTAPFAFILEENAASMALFRRVGFRRVCDGDWIAFGPTGQPQRAPKLPPPLTRGDSDDDEA